MIIDKKYVDIYDQLNKQKDKFKTGKQISDFFIGTGAIGVVFSLIPFIPGVIAIIFGVQNDYSIVMPLWFSCIFVFMGIFIVAQRYSQKITRKVGFSLEQELFLLGYDTLSNIIDYMSHQSSKSAKKKAVQKISELTNLLHNVSFPAMQLIRNDTEIFYSVVINMNKLVTLINRMNKIDTKYQSEIIEAITKLLDYAVTPKFESLVIVNNALLALPVPEKTVGKLGIFKTTVVRNKSIIQYVVVFVLAVVVPYIVYQFDISLGAEPHDAFTPAFSALVFVVMGYLAILNLTRKSQKP
jgi:hypothetical protein